MTITKTQVVRKAKRLGCQLEYIGMDISLAAPAGYKLRDEVHYSAWTKGDVAMSEIWDEFYYQMERLIPCDCGCADEVSA